MPDIIDIREIEDDLRAELKEYTNIPQLIIGEQANIPKDEMIYPRIVMKLRMPTAELGVEAQTRKVIESQEEEYEHDVEITHHSFPSMTLNIDGFANPGDKDVYEYLQKIENWFDVKSLGQRWFDRYKYDIVIRDVNEINDATTEMQKDIEQRLNLDIILEVKKEVVVVEKTIEEVDYEANYN